YDPGRTPSETGPGYFLCPPPLFIPPFVYTGLPLKIENYQFWDFVHLAIMAEMNLIAAFHVDLVNRKKRFAVYEKGFIFISDGIDSRCVGAGRQIYHQARCSA
ncbi:hypothetical protein, partial [Muribaculum sp.]|uniref:hypothetical protein n=1 Tax=Muribaculum sp. TaxID=1918611 RepID=UPI00258E5B01